MPNSNRTTEALDRLAEGVEDLTDSQRWRDWLLVQSRFHNYSFGNTMLIMLQTGGTATRVAGFHAWRKLGRNVRRGEQAIWILAPMTRKVKPKDDGADEEPKKVVSGFKAAPVFDVSQTDGEPLPEIASRLDSEGPSGAFDRLREVAEDLGYQVEAAELPGEINGLCSYADRRIQVEIANAGGQQVKTLAHELAHALLHEDFDGGRALAELEAESVAFVVCAQLGLDTDEYSFGYVSVWAGGGDEAITGIRASGTRIQRAANKILSGVESRSPEIAGRT